LTRLVAGAYVLQDSYAGFENLRALAAGSGGSGMLRWAAVPEQLGWLSGGLSPGSLTGAAFAMWDSPPWRAGFLIDTAQVIVLTLAFASTLWVALRNWRAAE
jgi:hypothetical protein